MTLPKISTPSFFLELPSNGKKYKYRPYLVKEQKILLIAAEGGNTEELFNAIHEVIETCVEGLDVSSLPVFDFFYVYLKLFIASNGEETIIRLKHNEEDCQETIRITVDLNNVKIQTHDNHTNKIDLTPEIGVIMRYPTALELVKLIEIIKDDPATIDLTAMADCIVSVYDEENIYNIADITKEEFNEWIDSLGKGEIKKIQNFFITMPEIYLDVNYTCPSCGRSESVKITDFKDFFMLP
jgi:hypothetical protein